MNNLVSNSRPRFRCFGDRCCSLSWRAITEPQQTQSLRNCSLESELGTPANCRGSAALICDFGRFVTAGGAIANPGGRRKPISTCCSSASASGFLRRGWPSCLRLACPACCRRGSRLRVRTHAPLQRCRQRLRRRTAASARLKMFTLMAATRLPRRIAGPMPRTPAA